jgi:hypothetical protein
MNLVSVFAPSNYSNTVIDETFTALNASVMAASGYEIDLGIGTSGSAAGMPSQSSIILAGTPIIIHFNEVPALTDGGTPVTLGTGEIIQLSTHHLFSSGHVSGTNSTLKITGLYGTQIHVQLGAALTAGTRYYLRILKVDNMTLEMLNEGDIQMADDVYFNSFTIHNP